MNCKIIMSLFGQQSSKGNQLIKLNKYPQTNFKITSQVLPLTNSQTIFKVIFSLSYLELYYYLIKRMKNLLLQFLHIKTPQTDLQCFGKDYKVNPLIPPKDLAKSLQNKNQLKKFRNQIGQKAPKGLSLLRKLCIVHHCLIYYPTLCQVFRELDFKIESDDSWLNKNVINPYQHFLQKIVYSEEQYKQIMPQGVLDITFQNLFLIIKILNLLFLSVGKISQLARYYQSIETKQNKSIMNDFITLCACHAQSLYSSFRGILGELLRYNKPENEQMLRFLLRDHLGQINEEMQNLFLNKYFYHFNRDYYSKLFRIENLPLESKNYAEYLSSKPKQPIRKQKKSKLDQFLFGSTGRVNPEIYLSLNKYKSRQNSQIRSPSLATPASNGSVAEFVE